MRRTRDRTEDMHTSIYEQWVSLSVEGELSFEVNGNGSIQKPESNNQWSYSRRVEGKGKGQAQGQGQASTSEWKRSYQDFTSIFPTANIFQACNLSQ